MKREQWQSSQQKKKMAASYGTQDRQGREVWSSCEGRRMADKQAGRGPLT